MSSSSTPTPQPLLTRCLLIAAALYVLVWSLLPPLLSQSLPLDVVESLSWGREWQWGTYKHPTLGPSVLHVFYMAFGKVGPFLLSQLCIVATLWMVWLTGCRLMSRE
ncbi:MAG: 4-amino-4-deoxy-L-arabinose transferase, partial [Comamonas sp.]|nr:4-amino-4-deoxy-L-arabinose transferase [Comamonas sp.]